MAGKFFVRVIGDQSQKSAIEFGRETKLANKKLISGHKTIMKSEPVAFAESLLCNSGSDFIQKPRFFRKITVFFSPHTRDSSILSTFGGSFVRLP